MLLTNQGDGREGVYISKLVCRSREYGMLNTSAARLVITSLDSVLR